jgi:cobalt-zinc-cadmium efflux system protein
MPHLDDLPGQEQTLGNRLWTSVGLNVLITCAELVGGFFSGSVALLADAAHNLSDVFALVLAAFARTLGMRPPSLRHTYGLKRFEVLSALLNAAVLLAITAFLMKESFFEIDAPDSDSGCRHSDHRNVRAGGQSRICPSSQTTR